jgi:hypothetical protein
MQATSAYRRSSAPSRRLVESGTAAASGSATIGASVPSTSNRSAER